MKRTPRLDARKDIRRNPGIALRKTPRAQKNYLKIAQIDALFDTLDVPEQFREEEMDLLEGLTASVVAHDSTIEITLTQLSACTGLSVNHLVQLVRRGILPEGRKGLGDDYKSYYVPGVECIRIIAAHEPGQPWKSRAKETAPRIKWNSLIK